MEKTELKNNCFGRFYREITHKIFAGFGRETNEIADIAGLIARLSAAIHKFDDLIDRDGLPVAEARSRIFGDIEKKRLLDEIDEILEIRFDEREFENNLDSIEEYFEQELLYYQSEPTTEKIKYMLNTGNCDFRLYNSILYKYLIAELGETGEILAAKLDGFLQHYLELDLLLDHITDIDEDFVEGSFNTLLWALRGKSDGMGRENVHRKMLEEGIYGDFYLLAKDFYSAAVKALMELRAHKPLWQLLFFYLKGEMAGLKAFMDNRGYVDLAPELRIRYTDFDLTPPPWNREPLIDVRKKVRDLNEKLKDENRVIIALGGYCEHSGCRHCALSRGVKETTIDEFLQDLGAVDFSIIDTICLYTAGSFFKPGLDKMRPEILQAISQKPVRRIIVEARPESITRMHIELMVSQLKGIAIEVGMGLDHRNNLYRNKYLNKNISLADYERGLDVLKSCGVRSITYVAIGCPHLTEEQAIESALETARYAVDCGTDVVSFEPLILQKNTLQDKLFQIGKLEAPSEKSIEFVLKQVTDLAHERGVEIRLGGAVQVP